MQYRLKRMGAYCCHFVPVSAVGGLVYRIRCLGTSDLLCLVTNCAGLVLLNWGWQLWNSSSWSYAIFNCEFFSSWMLWHYCFSLQTIIHLRCVWHCGTGSIAMSVCVCCVLVCVRVCCVLCVGLCACAAFCMCAFVHVHIHVHVRMCPCGGLSVVTRSFQLSAVEC